MFFEKKPSKKEGPQDVSGKTTTPKIRDKVCFLDFISIFILLQETKECDG